MEFLLLSNLSHKARLTFLYFRVTYVCSYKRYTFELRGLDDGSG